MVTPGTGSGATRRGQETTGNNGLPKCLKEDRLSGRRVQIKTTTEAWLKKLQVDTKTAGRAMFADLSSQTCTPAEKARQSIS